MFKIIAENCNKYFQRNFSQDEVFILDNPEQKKPLGKEFKSGFMEHCLLKDDRFGLKRLKSPEPEPEIDEEKHFSQSKEEEEK